MIIDLGNITTETKSNLSPHTSDSHFNGLLD